MIICSLKVLENIEQIILLNNHTQIVIEHNEWNYKLLINRGGLPTFRIF